MLKTRGGALAGATGWGIDSDAVAATAAGIVDVAKCAELAVTVCGGNFLRGRDADRLGIDRVEADNVGMLGTAMNALILRGAIKAISDVDVRIMTAVPIPSVAEPYIRLRAISHLQKGRIVILACGIGEPFVTTDYPSVQRAIELKADLLLAAKHGTDGVYDRDPATDASAVRLVRLTHAEAIKLNLQVLNPAAFLLAHEHRLPLRIFGTSEPGALARILAGEDIGTLITT